MRYFAFFLLLTLSSCDKPVMETDYNTYRVDERGGLVFVETSSTGIDDIQIHDRDRDWIRIYLGNGGDQEGPETKALLVYDEEIVFEVKPNYSSRSRTGRISISSFTKTKTIKIKQSGKY